MGCKLEAGSGQWTVGNGLYVNCVVGGGQWVVDSGQCNGQCALCTRQWAEGSGQ
jgi:hypothetical protein